VPAVFAWFDEDLCMLFLYCVVLFFGGIGIDFLLLAASLCRQLCE
jgi:hypothetical protein